jgi:hypothetical protein
MSVLQSIYFVGLLCVLQTFVTSLVCYLDFRMLWCNIGEQAKIVWAQRFLLVSIHPLWSYIRSFYFVSLIYDLLFYVLPL